MLEMDFSDCVGQSRADTSQCGDEHTFGSLEHLNK